MAERAGPHLERNRKRRLRERAAKKLKKILDEHGYYCHWCHDPLVLLREIPEDAIIKKLAFNVTWKSIKGTQCQKFATVDHVIPLCESGTNQPQNLVPACGRCNIKRTNMKSPKSNKEHRTCPKCGGQKPKGRSKCAECRKGTSFNKKRGSSTKNIKIESE